MSGFASGEEAAWRVLSAAKPSMICRRSLARFEKAQDRYLLRILGSDFSITPRDRMIRCAEDACLASVDINFRLMTLLYLTNAKEVGLAGRLLRASQLRGGDAFFRGAHSLPVRELEREFGNSPEDFRSTCLALGAKPVPYGDVAVEIPVLPRLPMTFVLWVADEEFQARISILFDSTANEHLPLDALLAAAQATVKAILTRT